VFLQIKLWVAENLNWLGFVFMAVAGAIVGHAKAYEASAVEWPVRKHFWSLVRRSFYAGFIGLVVYFAYPYFAVPTSIAFIFSGILSVFGSESIDWLYAQAKARAERKNTEGK